MSESRIRVAASGGELRAGSSREARLARVFVELADTLVADFDLLDFLQVLVERTVELLSVTATGLMLSDQRGHLRVLASTSEQSRLLELFELQNAEGPCLDSFRTGSQVVNVHRDEAFERWPVFMPEATAAGFRSVHALPLRLRGTVVGAINLFCDDQPTLTPEDVSVGQAMADVATIGLLSIHTGQDRHVIAESLQEALNSRIVIEQAKGYLAEALDIDMDQGFHLIRNSAHSNGAKLSAIAEGVLDGSIQPATLQRTSP